MGDKIHDIFFEVGACATDDIHFALANDFRERYTELGSTHGTGQCDHHFATIKQVLFISFSSIHEGGGIKMAKMVLNELGNGSFGHNRNLKACVR
jgi:hypothetical protein